MQLIECGYRSIGYVGFSDAHEERETAPRNGVMEFIGRCLRLAWTTQYRVNVDSPFDMEACGKTAADFVEKNPVMQAIICADEIVGVGALIELEKRSRRVPDDIAVAGIGDASIAALVKPGLTTVRFFQFEIGSRATRLLLSRLNEAPSKQQLVDVGFELVTRGSSVSKVGLGTH